VTARALGAATGAAATPVGAALVAVALAAVALVAAALADTAHAAAEPGDTAAAPAPAGAEVRAELVFDSAQVHLHEQVVASLRITHPIWAQPRWDAPAFEGFWSERISSIGEAVRTDGQGRRVRTTIFRRSLFPTRTGVLEIAPSRLRYVDQEKREQRVEVPGGSVRVVALPVRDRPEGFADVVGDVRVSAHLSRSRAALGRSVRLVIEYYGDANLWNAAVPELDGLFGADVEVFPDRPYTTTGERGGMLTLRRSLSYDLVARDVGRFILPPFELAYFDPDAGAYRTARSESLVLEVVRASAAARARAARPPAPAPAGIEVPWLATGLLLLAVGALVAWTMTRWWRSALRPVFGPPPPSPRRLFEEACAAVGTSDFAELLGRAVKAGIHARYHFDPRPLTSDEIASRIDDPDGPALLRRLDRARFSPGSENVEALLASARRFLDL
jgi:hypothetical protein